MGASSVEVILAASEHFMLSKAKKFWMRTRRAGMHHNVVQFYGGERLIIPSDCGAAPTI